MTPEENAAREKGFRVGVQFMSERLWMSFRANFMTSSNINPVEKEIYRILDLITEDVQNKASYYCSILPDVEIELED
jgi:hypothetical protein